MSSHTIIRTRAELLEQRAQVLRSVGLTADELRTRARVQRLTVKQQEALDALSRISFLLKG